MIRILKCKDKRGNDFNLKAIKHPELSKYEILLPDKYLLVYSGMELCHDGQISSDLDMITIKQKRFSKRITAVNLNTCPIDDEEYNSIRWKEPDNDIERFKRLVNGSIAVHITLNKDRTLNQILYYYKLKSGFVDMMELIGDIDDLPYYLMKEEY